MSKKHKDWSGMTQEKLQVLVDEHGTLTAVARWLGVTRAMLSHLVARRGMSIVYDRSRRRKKPSALDRYVPILTRLASIGWSCPRIAAALELPVKAEQVRRWLRDNGVALLVQRGSPSGKWNPAWVDGDRKARKDCHHQARKAASVREGRPLLQEEVVHHIDGDPANNNPSNLMVCESQAAHMRIHHERWQADYQERLARLRAEDRRYVQSLGWSTGDGEEKRL